MADSESGFLVYAFFWHQALDPGDGPQSANGTDAGSAKVSYAGAIPKGSLGHNRPLMVLAASGSKTLIADLYGKHQPRQKGFYFFGERESQTTDNDQSQRMSVLIVDTSR